jgi:hypothetical protein
MQKTVKTAHETVPVTKDSTGEIRLRQIKIKLQFSTSKTDYLHGKNTYLSDKVSLHFPKEMHQFFIPFKGRHLAINVSRKDKTVLITLTELDED